MNQKAFTLKELLIFISLVLVLIVFGVALLGSERARVRDSQRIADMTQVRFGFETLFSAKNSYAEAAQGCGQVGSEVSSCSLADYLSDISLIKDPGKYRYQIFLVPTAENYGVSFYLERTYHGLARGKHILSASGIQ